MFGLLFILVFLLGMLSMGLQLVASRVLAPFCSGNDFVEYNASVHRPLRPPGKIRGTLGRFTEWSFDSRKHYRSVGRCLCANSNIRHPCFTSRLVDLLGRDSISALVGVVFALLTILPAASCYSAPEQLSSLSFETPYNHITIERNGSIVEMRSFWRSRLYRESAVDLNDPARLLAPYTVAIASSAIFHPKAKRVLMIGLGGGGFNQFFGKAIPGATLETVELDPQVFELAQKYLGFKPTERNKVEILDGRMFLRHTKTVYDWIILDAFH